MIRRQSERYVDEYAYEWDLFAAAPYWPNGPPPSVNTSEGENVVFHCQTNGKPIPTVTFYKNGVGQLFRRFVAISIGWYIGSRCARRLRVSVDPDLDGKAPRGLHDTSLPPLRRAFVPLFPCSPPFLSPPPTHPHLLIGGFNCFGRLYSPKLTCNLSPSRPVPPLRAPSLIVTDRCRNESESGVVVARPAD